MFSWIVQSIIISLVLIILIHYLFTFFKTTLTVPKIKDLVNRPQQKYEDLLNTIKTEQEKPISTPTPKPILKPNTSSSMKDELKNFMKDLNKTPSEPTAVNDFNNTYSHY